MLFGVYLTYLLFFALTPFTFHIHSSEPLLTQVRNTFEGFEGLSSATLWDVWTNLLLFVPFGFLFPSLPVVATRPLATRLLLGTSSACLMSAGIECLQVLLPRHPSISDIVLNILGAFVGGVGYVVHRLSRAPRQTDRHAFRSGTSSVLPLVSYALALVLLFGVPFPLAKDFSEWTSEFDLYLGSQDVTERSWSGEIYLISLYNRVLHQAEVRTNFSAGPHRGSGLPRVEEGQRFSYDFSRTVRASGTGIDGPAVPIHLGIEDSSRIEWLTPNGLAVRDTRVSLFSRPVASPSAGRFFAHRRFSVEAWVVPFDRQDWGTARLVSYSTNPERGAFALTEWKQEVTLSLGPFHEGGGWTVPVAGSMNQVLGTVPRHVVVSYDDGLETSYVNGIEVERRWQRFKNASIDRLIGFLGQPFAWPLYSALMFPLGYLTFRANVRHRGMIHSRWVSCAVPVVSLTFLQSVRSLALNAPIEPSLLLVGAGTVLASMVIAPHLADHLNPR